MTSKIKRDRAIKKAKKILKEWLLDFENTPSEYSFVDTSEIQKELKRILNRGFPPYPTDMRSTIQLAYSTEFEGQVNLMLNHIHPSDFLKQIAAITDIDSEKRAVQELLKFIYPDFEIEGDKTHLIINRIQEVNSDE